MSAARTEPYVPTLADIEQRCSELQTYAADQSADAASCEVEDLFDFDDFAPQPPHPEPPELPDPAPEAPPILEEAALHGLAGEAVCALAPHSEADPVALLLQFLAAFGNLAGSAPHAQVGSTRHALNLFVILVGESSKARKGTSWRQIADLFAQADPDWAQHRIATTRPTPFKLLAALRGQPATDRRLFLLAEEFASVLHQLSLPSGQLSALLRCAWDGGDLSAHDGHHPVSVIAPHISLVGHITQSELVQRLTRNDSLNGFANRCLWTSVQRSQSLPEGGSLPDPQSGALVRELVRVVQWINSQPQLLFCRSAEARTLWSDTYPELSAIRPGVFGAATSRAEAQVLRLSALYAALDTSPLVETCHLQAALAVWDYCQASAHQFFAAARIDLTARIINEALTSNTEGLSKTQLRDLFHRRISADRLDRALEQLVKLGLISSQTTAGAKGRPATQWAHTKTTQPEN